MQNTDQVDDMLDDATNETHEEGETYHLTQMGIDLVEKRDSDGGITALREAREYYQNGDFEMGDSRVLLVAMYGMIFGNQELLDAAKNAKRFVAADS